MRRTLALTLMFALALGRAVPPAAAQAGVPGAWSDPVTRWAAQLRFSHRLHVKDVEAKCADCHPGGLTSTQSSDLLLPSHEQCAVCHDVEKDEGCAQCHTQGIFDPWAATVRTIRFDHSKHAGKRGVECATCHAAVDTAQASSTHTLPRMETCLACHDNRTAPAACETCHERVETLRPQTHQEVDWQRAHARWVRTGGAANQCAACHSDKDCQTCHVTPALQFTDAHPPGVLPEMRPAPSGRQTQVLDTVHRQNFRFTHGVDARTKRSECVVCHEPQRFCVPCHAGSQDAGFASPVPLSHAEVDFTRIGAGGGGGLHAQLARSDIEACAACHDVEGRDPVCITCHVDRTPGLGNDPRTHLSSRRGEFGDWHADSGSVCFSCHTDSHVAGVGFCGYCHGHDDSR